MVPKYWKSLQYIASCFNILQVVPVYWKSIRIIASYSHLLEVVSIYCKSFQYIASRSHLLEPSYIASSIGNCPNPIEIDKKVLVMGGPNEKRTEVCELTNDTFDCTSREPILNNFIYR